jgi:hypothetical protein
MAFARYVSMYATASSMTALALPAPPFADPRGGERCAEQPRAVGTSMRPMPRDIGLVQGFEHVAANPDNDEEVFATDMCAGCSRRRLV